MSQLSATELAKRLSVTKGRVSQYVAEGKLSGCYEGDGRARRFDLAKCAERLGRVLDKGQMLGNGLETRRALRRVSAAGATGTEPTKEPAQKRDGVLDPKDPDRFELAKIATAEENLRRIRRDNALAEGNYVLAEAAQREMTRLIGQEIAEIDTVLRDAARVVADKLGVEFKVVRKVLMDTWRAHRAGRSSALEQEVASAALSDREVAEDI
jgi:hypothetical protein